MGSSSAAPRFGAVEAGGTKFVCAVGSEDGAIRDTTRFPTADPASTLDRVIAYFRAQPTPIEAIGIGAFGPIDPRRESPTFGYITSTPKPGWRNCDVAGTVARALGVPIAFETDVNAAVYGEYRFGAARGADVAVYITVGTGIGGGVIVGGRLLHGLAHPEIGHMRVPHDHAADPFPGSCPYHGDCLEGLASGPAIAARYGARGETLPPDHPGWDLEARYLALAISNLVFTLAPQRIIVGGGVASQPHLLPRVRAAARPLFGDYAPATAIADDLARYVTAPSLETLSSVTGAIALAADLARARA